ncbi:transposase [Microbacterium sp.]|uniref:transposase n=1 Tax=Microbacterium sp. TaxID=51671 RepID=UPI003F6FBDDD
MTDDNGAMDAGDLDAVAGELYVLPPADFTSARNAKATGPHAAQIKAFRKPVVAAWAVNLLVAAGGLSEALELAAALREAQDDLDAPELARLGRQRRALVSALATQAVAAARGHDVAVSAAAREDIEKTLNAAMMDAAAAAAVTTGRLVRPLVATGLDTVDLAGAVAGSTPDGPVATAPSRDDLAERRARKAAEKAAREADRAANEAARELARVEAKCDKAQERVDHLAERVDDLERELERMRADAATAASDLERWEHEREGAASIVRSAEKKAKAARDAIA